MDEFMAWLMVRVQAGMAKWENFAGLPTTRHGKNKDKVVNWNYVALVVLMWIGLLILGWVRGDFS